jgi:hypothetical protein
MISLLPGLSEQQLSLQAILDLNYAFARTAILVASVPFRPFTQLAHRALTPLEFAACADTGPPAIPLALSLFVNAAQGRIRTASGVADG